MPPKSLIPRLRRLVAAIALLASALAPASAAAAAPAPLGPNAGEVLESVAPAFTVRLDAPATAAVIDVSNSPETDADGRLAEGGRVASGVATPLAGRPGVVAWSPGVGELSLRAGTYHWQARATPCDVDCTGPVHELKIAGPGACEPLMLPALRLTVPRAVAFGRRVDARLVPGGSTSAYDERSLILSATSADPAHPIAHPWRRRHVTAAALRPAAGDGPVRLAASWIENIGAYRCRRTVAATIKTLPGEPPRTVLSATRLGLSLRPERTCARTPHLAVQVTLWERDVQREYVRDDLCSGHWSGLGNADGWRLAAFGEELGLVPEWLEPARRRIGYRVRWGRSILAAGKLEIVAHGRPDRRVYRGTAAFVARCLHLRSIRLDGSRPYCIDPGFVGYRVNVVPDAAAARARR